MAAQRWPAINAVHSPSSSEEEEGPSLDQHCSSCISVLQPLTLVEIAAKG